MHTHVLIPTVIPPKGNKYKSCIQNIFVTQNFVHICPKINFMDFNFATTVHVSTFQSFFIVFNRFYRFEFCEFSKVAKSLCHKISHYMVLTIFSLLVCLLLHLLFHKLSCETDPSNKSNQTLSLLAQHPSS